MSCVRLNTQTQKSKAQVQMSCVKPNTQTQKSKACLELGACPGALKQTTAAAKPNRHTSAVSLGDCARKKSGGRGGEGQRVENSGVHRRERNLLTDHKTAEQHTEKNGQDLKK